MNTITIKFHSNLLFESKCKNFQTDECNIVNKAINQIEKENYVVDMLVNTLYPNNVSSRECYRIFKDV